ncbi:MAG: hypothetical protein WB771_07530 [Solirubrobacterales bacterium]
MASAPEDDVLGREVYVGDEYKRFGEMTTEDARALAEQLSGLSGGGLEQKVAPVGRAWRELAEAMEQGAASTVAELGIEEAAKWAEQLRVVPPGGTWL